MEKNITFLITGATGFIGRHLVGELAKENCEVRCLVRSPKKKLWNSPNVRIFLGDLSDSDSLDMALKGAGVCIHLASVINSGNRAEFECVNVKGMERVIEACVKGGVGKFIYVSSIDAIINPGSLYGVTKLAAEGLLKKSPLKFTIFRPTIVYGEGDDKHVASLIRLIKSLPLIPVLGNGLYRRQPVYVLDLVSAIKKSVYADVADGKTYNIAGSDAMTMNEILYAIAASLKKKIILVHLPTGVVKKITLKIGGLNKFLQTHSEQILSMDMDKAADISLAKKELGFDPVTFKEGLKRTVGWFRKN